eukprot:364505-Chlamydomonas_euryale.AAC.14
MAVYVQNVCSITDAANVGVAGCGTPCHTTRRPKSVRATRDQALDMRKLTPTSAGIRAREKGLCRAPLERAAETAQRGHQHRGHQHCATQRCCRPSPPLTFILLRQPMFLLCSGLPRGLTRLEAHVPALLKRPIRPDAP